MQTKITVRRVGAEEWERLRVIRLRALTDAPMAFGSTLADEQARSDEFWRGRATGGAVDLNWVDPTASVNASGEATDHAQQRLLEINPQILTHALGLDFEAWQFCQ